PEGSRTGVADARGSRQAAGGNRQADARALRQEGRDEEGCREEGACEEGGRQGGQEGRQQDGQEGDEEGDEEGREEGDSRIHADHRQEGACEKGCFAGHRRRGRRRRRTVLTRPWHPTPGSTRPWPPSGAGASSPARPKRCGAWAAIPSTRRR